MTNDNNSRVNELLAKEEISDVIMRLARGTDRRDVELIRSCYHSDAVDDHGAFLGSGAEFADWAIECLAAMKTMHFLGQIRIEIEGDVAHAESYCEAHHVFEATTDMSMGVAGTGKMDSVMWLRYVDRIERRDRGPWLIAERRCVYDWTYVLPASQSWPLDENFTLGRTDRSDPSYRDADRNSEP